MTMHDLNYVDKYVHTQVSSIKCSTVDPLNVDTLK